MAIEEKKFLGTAAVERLIANTREEIAAGDEATLSAAKKHAEDLGVLYDPAGVAQTKVDELANGAVKANAEAIAKLNGDADTEGSVAKAVADAKALVDADVDNLEGRMDSVEADIGDVENLETTAKNLSAAINEVRNAVSAGGVSAAVTMDTTTTTEGMAKSYTLKQGENVIGTIDIPKDMVVESGDVVTLADGEVEGYAAGTYIKLVLANANNDVIYVNVGSLVDIYKAQASATQIQLAIDSSSREISATIVAGSVTATELAADAVTTVKIADGNVTKAKLSAAVQASLDKADAAATKAEFDEEVARAKAAEKANADAIAAIDNNDMLHSFNDVKAMFDDLDVGMGKLIGEIPEDKTVAQMIADAESNAKSHADGLDEVMDTRVKALEAKFGDGEGNVEAQIAAAVAAEKERAEGVEAGLQEAIDAINHAETGILAQAKAHADELNTAMDERMDAVETAAHTHDNKDVLDGITAEKVAAWEDVLPVLDLGEVGEALDFENPNAITLAEEVAAMLDAFVEQHTPIVVKFTVNGNPVSSVLNLNDVYFDGGSGDLAYVPCYNGVYKLGVHHIASDEYGGIHATAPSEEYEFSVTITNFLPGEWFIVYKLIDTTSSVVITLGSDEIENGTISMTGPEIIESMMNGNEVYLMLPMVGVFRADSMTWDGKSAIFHNVSPYSVDKLDPVINEIQVDDSGNLTSKTVHLAMKDDVDAIEARVEVLEGVDHEHSNKAELDKIVEGDKAKWDAAQANAEATAAADATAKANQALADANAYTVEISNDIGASIVRIIGADDNGELHKLETTAQTVYHAINEVNDKVNAIDLSGIETNASDIDKLEASLAEGGATANAIADAKKAGTDASDAVTSLENGKVADLRTDVDALKAVSYVEITADEIDAMFETA